MVSNGHVTKVMKMEEIEKKCDIVLDDTIYAATSEGRLCITPVVEVSVQTTPDRKEVLLEAILDILKEIRDLLRAKQ